MKAAPDEPTNAIRLSTQFSRTDGGTGGTPDSQTSEMRCVMNSYCFLFCWILESHVTHSFVSDFFVPRFDVLQRS